MKSSHPEPRQHPLIRWTRFITGARWAVIISFFLATGLIFHFITGNLGIITNTAGMLSPDLHYLQVYRAYKKAFPQSSDTIVAVIDGETPDLAMDARDRLSHALEALTAQFKTVYAPGSETFFKKNGLLFLSESELDKLVNRIAEIQPLLGSLITEPDLRGLFSILEEAQTHGKAGELEKFYKELGRAVDATLKGKFYQVSWVRLMGMDRGPDAGSGTRQFVIVQPDLDYSTILPGKAAMTAVRDAAAGLHLDPAHGVRMRLTGDIAMEYEELASVTKGAKLAGWLSLIMVTIVLFTGLKSPKMVFATIITLVTGLIWTAGFAAAAIGHLNMISVAFAVLFIGLGVDYSIHYCLRFRELLAGGMKRYAALEETSQNVGTSLVLCAVTTAIGFFAFVPTDFSGVGELGLISGTGMFIGLFINLTLLPALLSTMNIRVRPLRTCQSPSGFLNYISFPVRHARAVRITALVLGAASLLLVPRITYDWNPMNLRDQSCESVTTFKELLTNGEGSPWSLKIVEKPSEELARKLKTLKSLPVVDKVIDVESFVPEEQEEKLSIIEEMDFMTGPLFLEEPAPPPSDRERIMAMQSFLKVLQTPCGSDRTPRCKDHMPEADTADITKKLSGELTAFLAEVTATEFNSRGNVSGRPEVLLKKLEQHVLGSLEPRLMDLKLSLEAEKFSVYDLPPDIASRWISADGLWRVEIFPALDLNHRNAMINFINEVSSIEPEATGYPVLIREGGKVVSDSFKQAFAMSFAAIALLLIFLMPEKKDAFLVMIPLVLAGVLTGAVMELSGISLNFANIIALPLIMGIGVDNGIHMVHRFRSMGTAVSGILATSTSRGILFSTLTTICSFGNLAVSPHQGMASMGKLLTMGVGFTLICTLILLPALLTGLRQE